MLDFPSLWNGSEAGTLRLFLWITSAWMGVLVPAHHPPFSLERMEFLAIFLIYIQIPGKKCNIFFNSTV
jgi:hypothetical protein